MIRTLSISLMIALFFFSDFIPQKPHLDVKIAENEPSYSEWGKIAMEKTKEKYPQAKIVDYLHLGKEKGAKYSTEKFKLWLKRGQKEFGVFVNIKFDNETEQIVNITYQKTDRSNL